MYWNYWYFCEHSPLFYHLNLILCRYWSWQRNIYFLVNIFLRHTFPTSKSSSKTKTVLTTTDMTQSTELQAFKRQKMVIKLLNLPLFVWCMLTLAHNFWQWPKQRFLNHRYEQRCHFQLNSVKRLATCVSK